MTDTDVPAAPAGRRAMLERAGEQLVLPGDVMDLMVRFSDFAKGSGIPADELHVTGLVTTPLPPLGLDLRGPTRPRANFLWHPLMWLPDRLSTLMSDGETVEPLDCWALRVALEMSESGMYDQATGTWFDILAHLGLNVDDPDDVARVAAWQDGADDPLLDGFDLGDLLDVGDPTWAADMAELDLDLFRQTAWCRAARCLGSLARDAIEDEEFDGGPEERTQIVGFAAVGGSAFLAGVEGDIAVDFLGLLRQVRAGGPELLDDPVGPAYATVDALSRIERAFEPAEDALIELLTDETSRPADDEDAPGEPVAGRHAAPDGEN